MSLLMKRMLPPTLINGIRRRCCSGVVHLFSRLSLTPLLQRSSAAPLSGRGQSTYLSKSSTASANTIADEQYNSIMWVFIRSVLNLCDPGDRGWIMPDWDLTGWLSELTRYHQSMHGWQICQGGKGNYTRCRHIEEPCPKVALGACAYFFTSCSSVAVRNRVKSCHARQRKTRTR
jgi:hypothetical protein